MTNVSNMVVCPDGIERRFDAHNGQTGRVRFSGKSVKGFNVDGLFVPDVTSKNGSAFRFFGSPVETE